MPTSALARVRYLCLCLAVLSVLLPLPLAIERSETDAWLRVVGVAASIAVAVYWLAGYRRTEFPLWSEPLEAIAVGLSLVIVPAPLGLAPLFGIMFRSLYGTRSLAAVRFVLYAIVLLLVVGPVADVASVAHDEPVAGRVVGLAVAAAGLQFIRDALLLQERGEEAFRLLHGAKDYAVFMLDAHGRIRSWNSGAARMLGYRQSDIIGAPFARFAADEDDRAAAHLEAAAREGSVEAEGWHRRKDGALLFAHVVLTAQRNETGELGGYSVILRDITERREANVALARSEERLRTAVEGAPVVLWTLDRDGIVTLCVGGGLRALGLDPARVVGRPLERLGRFHERLIADNRFALQGHPVHSSLDYDGRLFETRYTPVYDETGAVNGVIAVATDVTAQEIAERLQRSLLPKTLPDVPSARMAARYRAGAAGSSVGGDWYDVIGLSEGRLGLVVGDVVGRGAEAASLMGQLRTALLVTALEVDSPGEVLERVNHLVPRLGFDQSATALYAILDPSTGALRYASAGHLPPLVVAAERPPWFLSLKGALPLGALELTPYEDRVAQLSTGDTLLLYTDGLVERPGVALAERLELLRRVAVEHDRDVDALCDDVLRALVDPTVQDDVALLAVKSVPLPLDGFELDVPAVPEALASVRSEIGRWLARAGADPRELHRIQVACGEACANAVEHAYGPGEGRLRLTGMLSDGNVELCVRDTGHWRPPRGGDRGRGLKLMAVLVNGVEVIRDSEGTRVVLRHRIRAKEHDGLAGASAND